MLVQIEEGKNVLSCLPPPSSSKDWWSVPPGYWVSLRLLDFLYGCPSILSLSDKLILWSWF
jgi:hypothetical protein